ncbi:MAG: hypothetical protein FJ298_04065 [Planctomycetes bacterium]|nr:hypothetical protein [Planctomycetota bacterium]
MSDAREPVLVGAGLLGAERRHDGGHDEDGALEAGTLVPGPGITTALPRRHAIAVEGVAGRRA